MSDRVPLINGRMTRHQAQRLAKGTATNFRKEAIRPGTKEYEELKPPYPYWMKEKKGKAQDD